MLSAGPLWPPLCPPDEVSGQLILSNLSLASSGTYRCVATNQMGSASCELALSVTGRAGLWRRPCEGVRQVLWP